MLALVIVPSLYPFIFATLRIMFGVAWKVTLTAELFGGNSGLGYMINHAREFLQTDVVVLGILIYALLGKAADMATLALERRCLAWHPAFQPANAA